jgi:hypothetical protein
MNEDVAGLPVARLAGNLQSHFAPHVPALRARLPPVLELGLDNHSRCSVSGTLVTPAQLTIDLRRAAGTLSKAVAQAIRVRRND